MLPGSLCHQWGLPLDNYLSDACDSREICMSTEGWRRRLHIVRVLYMLLCIIPVCHAQALNKYLIASGKPILFIKLS